MTHMLKPQSALRGLCICEWLIVVFVAGKAAEVIDRHVDVTISSIDCCMKPLLWSTFACRVQKALFQCATCLQANLQHIGLLFSHKLHAGKRPCRALHPLRYGLLQETPYDGARGM